MSTADRDHLDRNLGTGELTFRLRWGSRADLDLHVTSPLGESIFFMEPTSESGGELDFDCNATPDSICRRPVENVYWPTGAAPQGAYEYEVRLVNRHGAEMPVRFRVLVMENGRVATARQAELSKAHSSAGPWTFVH